MKSKVYFVKTNDSCATADVIEKLNSLISGSGMLGSIASGDKVAVKVHFGEEGNTGFVDPEYVGVVCKSILDKTKDVVLSDTNTLYKGRRTNSADHVKLAHEHGFTKDVTGVDVVIPDETNKEDIAGVQIDKKYIKTAKIGRLYKDADVLVAISHFKGHMLTGFGGAIKNLGMGCAVREGKMMQHNDNAPVYNEENCVGCGECEKVCPVRAIEMVNGKASIDVSKCIGCSNCVGVCPAMAMFIDMEAGEMVQHKMTEYACAALKDKNGKVGFVNFAVKINKECDCWGMENPRIAPDVGILASSDPVAVDKASFDLVNKVCGCDIFKKTHPSQDALKQIHYAHEIGLGSLDYELIEL